MVDHAISKIISEVFRWIAPTKMRPKAAFYWLLSIGGGVLRSDLRSHYSAPPVGGCGCMGAFRRPYNDVLL